MRAAAVGLATASTPAAARGLPQRRPAAPGPTGNGGLARRPAVADRDRTIALQLWTAAAAAHIKVTAGRLPGLQAAASTSTKKPGWLRTTQAVISLRHPRGAAAVARGRITATTGAAFAETPERQLPSQARRQCWIRAAAVGGATKVEMGVLVGVHHRSRQQMRWQQSQHQWWRHPQRQAHDDLFYNKHFSAAQLSGLSTYVVRSSRSRWHFVQSSASHTPSDAAVLVRCQSSALRHHRRVQAPRLPTLMPPPRLPHEQPQQQNQDQAGVRVSEEGATVETPVPASYSAGSSAGKKVLPIGSAIPTPPLYVVHNSVMACGRHTSSDNDAAGEVGVQGRSPHEKTNATLTDERRHNNDYAAGALPQTCRNSMLRRPPGAVTAPTASYRCSSVWQGDEMQRIPAYSGKSRDESCDSSNSSAVGTHRVNFLKHKQHCLAQQGELRQGVRLELPPQQQMRPQEITSQQESRDKVNQHRQKQQPYESFQCVGSVTSARRRPYPMLSHKERLEHVEGRSTGTMECEMTTQPMEESPTQQLEAEHHSSQNADSPQLILESYAKNELSSQPTMPMQAAERGSVKQLLVALMEAVTEYESLAEHPSSSDAAKETRRIQRHVLQLHEAIAAHLHEADTQQLCELRGHVESLLFRQKLLSHHQLLVRLVEELYKRELVGGVCTSMLVRYFRDLCNASNFNVTVPTELIQRLHSTLMERKAELLEKADLANALVLFLYNSALLRISSGDLFPKWTRLLLTQSRPRAAGGAKLRIAPPLIVFISRILVAERCGVADLWHAILDMTMTVDPRTSAEYDVTVRSRHRTILGERCNSWHSCNIHHVYAADADSVEEPCSTIADAAPGARWMARDAAAGADVLLSSTPPLSLCRTTNCGHQEDNADSESLSPFFHASAAKQAHEDVNGDNKSSELCTASANAPRATNALSASSACSDRRSAPADVAAINPHAASAALSGPLVGASSRISKFSTDARSPRRSEEGTCIRERVLQGVTVDATEEARWLGNAMRTISGAADFCIPRHPAVDVVFERLADVAATPHSDAHRLLFHCRAQRHSMRLLHFLWSLCLYNFHLHPKFLPILETCCMHGRLEYAAQCRLNFRSPAFIPFQTADAIMHDRRGEKSVADFLPSHCRNLMQAVLMGVKPSCSLWASNFLSPHPLFRKDFAAVLDMACRHILMLTPAGAVCGVNDCFDRKLWVIYAWCSPLQAQSISQERVQHTFISKDGLSFLHIQRIDGEWIGERRLGVVLIDTARQPRDCNRQVLPRTCMGGHVMHSRLLNRLGWHAELVFQNEWDSFCTLRKKLYVQGLKEKLLRQAFTGDHKL